MIVKALGVLPAGKYANIQVFQKLPENTRFKLFLLYVITILAARDAGTAFFSSHVKIFIL